MVKVLSREKSKILKELLGTSSGVEIPEDYDEEEYLPKTPSKKRRLTKKVSSKESEDYNLKQIALRLLVDKSISLSEAATEMNISIKDLQEFFKDKNFVEDLHDRIERIYGIDADYRLDQNKFTLDSLYKEMRRRAVNDEFKHAPLRDLSKMIIDFQKELRLDTPGEFTSKVGMGELTDLQVRYKKSLSGKLNAVKVSQKVIPEKTQEK
jgi:hypothetical protein